MRTKRWLPIVATATLAIGALTGPGALAQDSSNLKLGFVTHVLGNPFIQQIIDGANAAAKDLGVELQVVGPTGGDPNEQLTLVQGLVANGAQGIATSVPGESMVSALNEIVDSGIPVVQFNLLQTGVKAPYVGERSVASGRTLGQKVAEKLAADGVTGATALIGNCFPGFPVLENRAKGVEESLDAAGITYPAVVDVKVAANENYAAWEAFYGANPSAAALIGLCAPDIASLGQLQAANPNTRFVSGGYDLTAENLAAVKAGNAYVSIGQTPFMQGYLPIKILVDTLTGVSTVDLSAGGFLDAGSEIVTADSVTEPFGLPQMSFADLEAIAADPAAARVYYQPLVDGQIANWAKYIEPIANESQ